MLRPLTGNHQSVPATGATVREVIDSLEAKYPGIKERLCRDDSLRPGLAVVIDTQVSREGLSAAVNATSEVHFIPAVSGG
jgi:sulfur-carrier protein